MPVTSDDIRAARQTVNAAQRTLRQAERQLARLEAQRIEEKAAADEAKEAKRIAVGDVLTLNDSARDWLRQRGYPLSRNRRLHVVSVYEESGRRVVFVRAGNPNGRKYAMPASIVRSMK